LGKTSGLETQGGFGSRSSLEVMLMHPEHARLLAEVQRLGTPQPPGATGQNDSYGGSGRPYYLVSVPDRRAMARRWVTEHRRAPAEAVLAVVESLLDGDSHEERTLATLLLRYGKPARLGATPAHVDRWLDHLNGWAEVDSLCQNVFTAEQMLADWPAWRGLVERLSKDANINKRRASVVLLTGPVHYDDDRRLADLAFAVIERVKTERPILITKAVSWLLRALADRHQTAVAAYIDANEASLPRVAVREARTKLRTGTKSGRSKRGS
jgi:3-methyladenine DNA glycosylase AlkD